jgi:hypothetical protein
MHTARTRQAPTALRINAKVHARGRILDFKASRRGSSWREP